MPRNLKQLCRKLGHQFHNDHLLEMALTHRSVDISNNERLEFLGDAILNLIIAEALYHKHLEAKEGALTRSRASLVKGETLAAIAREFDLGAHLNLGSGELKSGGQQRTSILADALEAIVAAIYLDAGIDACKKCVLKWYEERLNDEKLLEAKKDAKTQLQEYLQARRFAVPRYAIISADTDAINPTFHVKCSVDIIDFVAEGKGSSRRRAEQEAAEKMLSFLLKHEQ